MTDVISFGLGKYHEKFSPRCQLSMTAHRRFAVVVIPEDVRVTLQDHCTKKISVVHLQSPLARVVSGCLQKTH